MTTAGGPALGGDLGQHPRRTDHTGPRRTSSRGARFFHGALDVVKQAGLRWADDACYRLGASLAYYAFFSI
ncbi:MAG: hypothetical protein JOZ69_09385, partial [Myxococcales bacterium]|nr:hypothetical protein [Myxococcales bacterium]